jgi:transglutaminase-like putative cysteine protease
MPLLTIHHKTEYTYAHPVAFGEHRIMLRPRDGHDLRVIGGNLDILPRPASLRWIHDVFGNTVAIAEFDMRADRLVFSSRVTVDHIPTDEIAIGPDDEAYYYPFSYDADEIEDLALSIAPQYSDPEGRVERWALGFLREGEKTPTLELLSSMTHGVREQLNYRKRHEHGTQHPTDTLESGSGTCRDFALLMIEGLRRLGIAARFVTGYLYIPPNTPEEGKQAYVGGGSTHAWVQAYLPSAGWVEFDPTNGIVGSRDLIRVAVARDPRQAIPLHGTFYGKGADYLGMNVSISVVQTNEPGSESARKRERT